MAVNATSRQYVDGENGTVEVVTWTQGGVPQAAVLVANEGVNLTVEQLRKLHRAIGLAIKLNEEAKPP